MNDHFFEMYVLLLPAVRAKVKTPRKYFLFAVWTSFRTRWNSHVLIPSTPWHMWYMQQGQKQRGQRCIAVLYWTAVYDMVPRKYLIQKLLTHCTSSVDCFLGSIREDVHYVKSIIPLSYVSQYDTCLICAQTQECRGSTSDHSKRSFTRHCRRNVGS